MNQQKRIAKAVLDAAGWITTLRISEITRIERHSISSYLSALRSLGLVDSRRTNSVFEYRVRDEIAMRAFLRVEDHGQKVFTHLHTTGKQSDIPPMLTLAEALLA